MPATVPVPSNPLPGASLPEVALPVAGPDPPKAYAEGDAVLDRFQFPFARRESAAKSWRLKLAVLLLVALLCIAFAGLIWSFVF